MEDDEDEDEDEGYYEIDEDDLGPLLTSGDLDPEDGPEK